MYRSIIFMYGESCTWLGGTTLFQHYILSLSYYIWALFTVSGCALYLVNVICKHGASHQKDESLRRFMPPVSICFYVYMDNKQYLCVCVLYACSFKLPFPSSFRLYIYKQRAKLIGRELTHLSLLIATPKSGCSNPL